MINDHGIFEIMPRHLPYGEIIKPRKALVMTADIPSEIRTGHRTNIVTPVLLLR